MDPPPLTRNARGTHTELRLEETPAIGDVGTPRRQLDSEFPVRAGALLCGNITRVLPCNHVYHAVCIDPWLLDLLKHVCFVKNHFQNKKFIILTSENFRLI